MDSTNDKNSILNEISSIAQEIQNSGERDVEMCKIGILFPFIEQLGYDSTTVGDIIVAPLYTPNASYKIDYGLRGRNESDIKSIVKLIPFDASPDDEIASIRTCLLQKDTIEYVIITDCFKYWIYSYDTINNILVEFANFDMCNPDEIDTQAMEILSNPSMEHSKQEYAEYEDDEPQVSPAVYAQQDPEPDDEPSVGKKKSKVHWGLIILSQIAVIALIIFIVLSFKNPESSFLNIFNSGGQNNLDYYSISSSLELTVPKNTQELQLSFYSKDIPQGGQVRFDIANGTNSSVVYGEVSSSGKISGKFNVPDNWENPTITVTASLRFDELDHIQPQNVKDKFGEIGDKIMGQEGAPDKFALTFATVEYDSAAVREYLAWLEEQRLANLIAERKADFANFEVRTDSLGNIKILPKSYKMDSINITGNVHIYPQIFYDASNNISHFYLVCGQISSVTWSMFRSVSFYADGTAWTYEIGNNEKKQQVVGQYITEWVYYDNFNISSLPTETALLGTADYAELTFNGSKAAKYTISEQEKANISALLTLYDKYFLDPNSPPDISWFEDTTSSSVNGGNSKDENAYALTYIYTPDSVTERDGLDQKNLNKLRDNLADPTKDTSPTMQTTYDIDSHKYRVLSDSFKTQLMNELHDTTAILVYGQDYESFDMNYYKLFFTYKNAKSIEDGYIPYMYVMENKTVYIPVKTDTGNIISEKSYASFILSQSTYDELLKEIENAEYQQLPA